MTEAFVLINCDLGAEDEIIRNLKGLDNVIEVAGIFGAYDIIAKVEAENNEVLRETITLKIRKMSKIRSSLTLMKVEGQGE
jgi:DNA-binding Lrp family transcriptional regulator